MEGECMHALILKAKDQVRGAGSCHIEKGRGMGI